MNWKVFRTRAITALVFVLVMMAGLLLNEWSFLLLFSVIHFGCWIEYQRLLGRIDPSYKNISTFHRYGVMLAGWSMMLYAAGDIYHIANITLPGIGLAMGLTFAFALPIVEILFSQQVNFTHIRYSALGLIYISLSWALMINIRSIHEIWVTGNGCPYEVGLMIPLVTIFSIWINDTMAYIVGSLIGKTPFSKISPKKTIEGTAGGIILCVASMGILAYFIKMPVMHICIIAAISAVAGTAGDLLESKIKRMANVKDSGSIMPGHGGFLDRFDSLLLATPFVWLYVMIVMK
ncbi:phosphatidate cytidylyltransferase [Terrimonas sp.]|uniref:phosphatidate cytidylyltransferase n=1 Tax=Terrimonas sp. TaxID=1914338 RepID=UPI001F0B89BE|nr:phosphatidate cytidylyltransferase [Terrimonas sp.]